MLPLNNHSELLTLLLLFHLCGLTPEVTSKLDINTLSSIKSDLNKLLSKQDYPLQRIVKIDGVKPHK